MIIKIPCLNELQGDLNDGKTLLGRIADEIGTYREISPAEQEKRWRVADRAPRQFLDDRWHIYSLVRILGQGAVLRLIGTATVPLGVASIITGIPAESLRSLATLKKLNPDAFLLDEIAKLAGTETVAAILFPWRPSHQAAVKTYLQDCIKDPYGESLAGR